MASSGRLFWKKKKKKNPSLPLSAFVAAAIGERERKEWGWGQIHHPKTEDFTKRVRVGVLGRCAAAGFLFTCVYCVSFCSNTVRTKNLTRGDANHTHPHPVSRQTHTRAHTNTHTTRILSLFLFSLN